MAITVYDEPCTETKNTTKILTIYDSAIPFSSSSFLNLSATFRDNIRIFLRDHAKKEDYTIDDDNNTTVFSLFIASEAADVVFPLFIVEEHISFSSPNPLCDFCRCVGWGHHYVSKRKYHLIIPRSDEWNQPLKEDSLKLTSNLMHGVIHCNGFGHLLCINTDDVSSNFLSGDQIMDFWDRLCSTLQTRKISLDDISRKGSMDLRLLHSAAYGRPWFGKWGYKFSHGSFGVREDQYRRAIHLLSSIELETIMEDYSRTRKERVMKMIIGFYKKASETPLDNLSELLQFMLAFGSKSPIARKTEMSLHPVLGDDKNTEVKVSSFCSSPDQESDDNRNDSGTETVLMDLDTTMLDINPPKYNSFDALAKVECSRWSGRRLNEAAQVVFKVFEERNSVLTRQELRDAVRNGIGDTGLIDFLLKHIDKVLIGNKIVQRFTNPKNRILQFSLRTFSCDVEEPKKRKKLKPNPQETNQSKSTTPGLNPYEDILYLYQNLFLSYPGSDIYSHASEIIWNCKSFVKEWPLPSHTVSCQVLPNHDDLLRDFTRKLPPGDLVILPQNTTIRDLKSVLEKALRDTYCIMDTIEVLEIRNKDLEKLNETSGIESEGDNVRTEFLVTVFGLDTSTELRYEGGFDDWIVDCNCGARDDDGERMVACDACRVWQHTLCNSIEDDEDVPSEFLCKSCCEDRLRSKKRSVTTR